MRVVGAAHLLLTATHCKLVLNLAAERNAVKPHMHMQIGASLRAAHVFPQSKIIDSSMQGMHVQKTACALGTVKFTPDKTPGHPKSDLVSRLCRPHRIVWDNACGWVFSSRPLQLGKQQWWIADYGRVGVTIRRLLGKILVEVGWADFEGPVDARNTWL